MIIWASSIGVVGEVCFSRNIDTGRMLHLVPSIIFVDCYIVHYPAMPAIDSSATYQMSLIIINGHHNNISDWFEQHCNYYIVVTRSVVVDL